MNILFRAEGGTLHSTRIILILGFANLIADGLSMAIGDCLSTKAEIGCQNVVRGGIATIAAYLVGVALSGLA